MKTGESERAPGGRRAQAAVNLRAFRADDVAWADELRALAGWNQTVRDWRGYLEFEPEGCFVAEAEGRPVGTATTIRYEEKFGWIGMVLVHPDYRRCGAGSTLLRAAIGYLQARGVRNVKLDATPMGKKVYGPLGFVDEYELTRYEGIAPAVAKGAGERGAAGVVVAFATAEFTEVARLDACGFGADRTRVLRALSERQPELCFASRREGRVAGFLIAREGTDAVQVGPWVARDAGVAEELLIAFFAQASGRRTFVDVVAPNAASVALVRRHGFTVQRTLTRMFAGENAHPGDTRLVYGIGSPEKG